MKVKLIDGPYENVEVDINGSGGLCECGCGGQTTVSPHNDPSRGWIKGKPRRFLQGHHHRLRRKAVWEEERGFETLCHIWRGGLNDRGYGQIDRQGNEEGLAHKVLWEERHGPVGAGLDLDHLCRQRDCVRDEHLEAVSHAENCRRGAAARTIERGAVHPIASLRVRLNLTQDDLGARLGVSGASVSLWENGKVPVPRELDIDTLTWREPYLRDAMCDRRNRVRRLHRDGASKAEMMRVLGCSPSTITKDLRYWREHGASSDLTRTGDEEIITLPLPGEAA